jgi:two-component system, chemotaxis family, chemotaxis protein CheY
MTILVVDDDASVRRLIRRVLGEAFDVEIVEADDGVTALQYLLEHSVDIVILDMWMPIISGLETLETIRRSSNHSEVPVVMMSGKADEAGVQRALRLGVTQIIAKPFGPGVLRDRFSDLIKKRTAEAPSRLNLLEIQDADTVLVVDTSAEFRELARHELRRLCRVEEAPNEFAAISRSLTGGIDLMVVGATSEMSSTELFGRKVRGIKQLRGLRLIAAVPEDEPRLTGLYDATIVRSFVADVLHASFSRTLQPHTLGRLLFHPTSPALAEFCDQARKTLSELLDGAVAMHVIAPGVPGESVQIGGTVEVQGCGTGWDVRVTCTMSTALQLGSRLLQKNVDELSESDSPHAVVQLAELIGKQLKDTMAGHGLQLQLLHARPSHEMAGPAHDPERSPSLCRRWFSVGQSEVATLEVVRLRRNDQADEGHKTAPAPKRRDFS